MMQVSSRGASGPFVVQFTGDSGPKMQRKPSRASSDDCLDYES